MCEISPRLKINRSPDNHGKPVNREIPTTSLVTPPSWLVTPPSSLLSPHSTIIPPPSTLHNLPSTVLHPPSILHHPPSSHSTPLSSSLISASYDKDMVAIFVLVVKKYLQEIKIYVLNDACAYELNT